jgi:hypothetical protein
MSEPNSWPTLRVVWRIHMPKKISSEKRKYLIALIKGHLCLRCNRPMFVAPGFQVPVQCWRCHLKSRGIPMKRVWE